MSHNLIKTLRGNDYMRRMLVQLDGRCFYCTARMQIVEDFQVLGFDIPLRVTLDHVFPVSKGGRTWLRNCVLACASCNRTKSDRDPTLDEVDRFDALKERMAAIGKELVRPRFHELYAQMLPRVPRGASAFWMCWRLKGGIPVKRHASFEAAEKEARRLASIHKGDEIYVLMSCKCVMSTPLPSLAPTIPIELVTA